MKGLQVLPTFAELDRTYLILQGVERGANAPDPADLALWTQWARFDPRMAEVLAGFFLREWHCTDPLKLNGTILNMPWPAALGVILEECEEHFLTEASFDRSQTLRKFRRWKDLVLDSVDSGATRHQLFFLGTRSFSGKLAFREAQQPSRTYRKWGFLGRESLFSKRTGPGSAHPPRVRFDSEVRRGILDDLIQNARTRGWKHVTVRDYLDAVGAELSLRQAELDLKQHPELRPRGTTKARVYRMRRPRRALGAE